ncbi:MAG: ATP-binding protein [Pelobium sp.]
MSIYNWSLKKLLSSEEDSFIKAKITILFTVLSFSILKAIIVIATALQADQSLQLVRAIVALVFYTILLKLLLFNKSLLYTLSHILIIIGIFIIWSNIFFTSHEVNIVTMQFVFMAVLSSFYLLGVSYGILYSCICTFPVIIYLLGGKDMIFNSSSSEKLASPGYEIIGIFNFLTIIISHYLFQKAFVSNIAEKEVLNAQLQEAVHQANVASQVKTDFLSTMSHELRTPLNAVIGMTNLFLSNPNSSDKVENLKILKFSAVSLHSVINDILDFNKLGANRLELESISVDLAILMNDICSGLIFQAKEKGIVLNMDISEDIKNKRVITDPTRITQIIYNLAGNALKFTTIGSVTVRLEVVDENSGELNIKFSVIDTGIGINEDKQAAVFEPFKQGSSSTTRDYGGTGLGLAIVKQLLLLFNSEIHLESILGKGSTFYFNIAFQLDKKVQDQPAPEELILKEIEDLSELRILVADDNMMNRLLLKKVFLKWNSEPVFVENGQLAIEKAKLQTFDVILMDLHMPIKNGYEAARMIRDSNEYTDHRLKIIAFTASVSPDMYDKIIEAGMDDYVFKPFDAKELYRKMKEISDQVYQKNLI